MKVIAKIALLMGFFGCAGQDSARPIEAGSPDGCTNEETMESASSGASSSGSGSFNGDHSFIIGPEYGEVIVVPVVPEWVSTITLRESSPPIPLEGQRIKIVYPPLRGSTASIRWIIVRETHTGARAIASLGNGWDTPSHDPDEGAEATFELRDGAWHMIDHTGAVVVGPDAD